MSVSVWMQHKLHKNIFIVDLSDLHYFIQIYVFVLTPLYLFIFKKSP